MLQPSHHRNSSNAADSSNHAVEKKKDVTQSQEYEMEVLDGQAIKDQLAQLNSVSTDVEDNGTVVSAKTGDAKMQDLMKELEEMRLQLAATKAELERERQQHSKSSNNTDNTSDTGALAEELALLKHQYDELKNNADRDAAEFEEVIDVQEKELVALKAEHSSAVDVLAQEKKALEDKVLEITEAASVATTTQEKETKNTGAEEEQFVVQQLQAEVKALRESHAKEMDEILVQLDEVEAEHAQQLQRVKEEVAVAAAQEQHDTDNQVMAATAQVLRGQLQEAQRKVRECQESYAARQKEYEESLEDERRAAADDARQEMINQAESQFEQANDMYVKLKEEFATSLDTTAELQGELDEALEALEAAYADASIQQEAFQEQLGQLQQGTWRASL